MVQSSLEIFRLRATAGREIGAPAAFAANFADNGFDHIAGADSLDEIGCHLGHELQLAILTRAENDDSRAETLADLIGNLFEVVVGGMLERRGHDFDAEYVARVEGQATRRLAGVFTLAAVELPLQSSLFRK